jgi:hypothetical protein
VRKCGGRAGPGGHARGQERAAARLGPTVVSTSDTVWTKQAVLRDPQGAELTVSQFTPPGGDR